jgi:hypothetical protein
VIIELRETEVAELIRRKLLEADAAAHDDTAYVRRRRSKNDWDEIVSGELRGFLGDAEGYAITQCYVKTLQWSRENTFDPEITFVFDNRPSEIQRGAKTIGDAFARHSENPRVAACEFFSSYDVCALQAADLFAWEVYQQATKIFAAGVMQPPRREALRRLEANIELTTQLATRRAIRPNRGLHKRATSGISKSRRRPFHKFRPFEA